MKRAIAAWSLYDFANSAFTTLVVTFVYAAFFTKTMDVDEIAGTALWSRGVTITAVCVALLSPVLGAIADQGGLRKRFLLVCTVLCVGGTVALYFPVPGGEDAVWAIAVFVVANVAFELAGVFYNAFLPDIAPAEKIGRVSGYGWALGYVGGLLCLVVAFVGFVFPEQPWFGLSTEDGENIRATNLLVAVWFARLRAAASSSTCPRKPMAGRPRPACNVHHSRASASMAATFRSRSRSATGRSCGSCIARLLYNDGLVTVFAFGAIYAQGITIGFEFHRGPRLRGRRST